jgi:glyoxylase-like metal-dependent hydrolase (beta-lactamase superfamily II)
MIHIHLDSVVLQENSSEYRKVPRAKCGEFESSGDGWNINKVAKMILDSGHDPEDEVYVLRGNTLCFTPDTLLRWAEGRQGTGDQPEQLKKAGK